MSAAIGGVEDTGRRVVAELTSPTCLGAAVDAALEPAELADRWTGTVKGVVEAAAGPGTAASRTGDGPPALPTGVSLAPSVAAWPGPVSSTPVVPEPPESG